ncbi:MAG TPA: succinate dehydrogenase, hydrophobic membrane anchor protein [Acidisoma sp.]|jgi:succinate dehydrogenase / fumarate reductase membrane anchor subunit|uniref:succinate dehydrogenase, hydrophobic membrane anchor protein n=1 Tax=Acidisoma sp. TaxID=1872115 RepID=UPI002C92B836|nr:succinate dehydrogenase, hydrophobic membrane anchor protein [Acidisoma sp.]HTI03073.1 succinate dehydrogenase, hydrophobic membrane anchor protein [Acidisoma sp.]
MAKTDKLAVTMRQTPLGQAKGLGSAKSGLHHWWAERVTSVALIPLTLWFVFSVLSLAGHPQPDIAHWVSQPLVAVLLIALIIASFHHTQLGLQMVLEDYVHDEGHRLIWMMVMKAIVWLLGLAAVLSVLKLAI